MVNTSTCAVAVCRNSGRKTAGYDISYYRFPKDASMRKVWIEKCRRADKINPENTRICSVHFPAEDFERNLKYELLQISKYRKKLKPSAVPSLFLREAPPTPSTTLSLEVPEQYANIFEINVEASQPSSRELRLKNRSVRKSALETIASLPPIQRTFDAVTDTDGLPEDPEVQQMRVSMHQLVKKLKLAEKSLEQARTSRDLLKTYLRQSEGKLRKLLKQNALNSRSGKPLRKGPKKKVPLNAEEKREKWLEKHSADIVKSMRNIFTYGQLRYAVAKLKRDQTTGRSSVHWSKDDIENARSIRQHVSKRLYRHLRTVGYPYPSESTLRNWAKSVHTKYPLEIN